LPGSSSSRKFSIFQLSTDGDFWLKTGGSEAIFLKAFPMG